MNSLFFSKERFNVVNFLRNAVFGNKEITKFDSTKSYTRDDIVYTHNSATHVVTMYKCIVDRSTAGTLSDTEWTTSFSGSFDTAIAISKTEPTSPDVQLWYKPLKEATHNLP